MKRNWTFLATLALLLGVVGWVSLVILINLSSTPPPVEGVLRAIADSAGEEEQWELAAQLRERMDAGEFSLTAVMSHASHADDHVRLGLALFASESYDAWGHPAFRQLIEDKNDDVGLAAVYGDTGLGEVAPIVHASLLNVAGSRRVAVIRASWALDRLREQVHPVSPHYAHFVNTVLDTTASPERRLAAAVGLYMLTDADEARVVAGITGSDRVTSEVCLVLLPRLVVTPPAIEVLRQTIKNASQPLTGAAAAELQRLRDQASTWSDFGTLDPLSVAEKLGPAAAAVAPVVRDRLIAEQDDYKALRRLIDVLTATGMRAEDITPELRALQRHHDSPVSSGVTRVIDEAGSGDRR